MKLTKYIIGAALLLATATGCKKETYDDVAFIEQATASDKLNLIFDITQDNTGRVTITPNGEGATYYEVFFGDGTTTPSRVAAGGNVQHTYREGVYTVRLLAYNIKGDVTEFTRQLTVTFRAPENLEVTTAISPASSFILNVSATALYETNFRVFFGDVPNEIPRSFQEGETISHTYAAVGTYTVRVVAVSGGAATTQVTRQITIIDPVLLPLNFESPTLAYNFINFAGGVVSVINNPQSGGINTSAKVGRMVKFPGEVYGGSLINLSSPIDFSANKYFRMKVFSPRVGAKVLLKVENSGNPGINFEREVTTTVANQWEDLVFDYTAINAAQSYNNIVLIFELGTQGDGSANFTFLFDDIRLVQSVLGLPLNFEATSLNYNFVNFGGGEVTVINNPQSNGINTSTRVGRMIKFPGEVYGGSVIELAGPMNFSTQKIFRMKVFSPRVGAKVLLKVENQSNGGISFEREVLTTVANQWEDMTFDFTPINTANSYSKIVLIFELGTQGDGTGNFTFYFDDIRLTN